MKSLTRFFLIAYTVLVFSPAFVPNLADAANPAKMPSFASSANAEAEIERKGNTFVTVVTAAAVIVCIIAIIWGGLNMGVNPQSAKTYVGGGVVGLVIISLAYAIAATALG